MLLASPASAKSASVGAYPKVSMAEARERRDGALTAAATVKHRPALAAAGLPTFYDRLDDYPGSEQAALALDLILLCMTRLSETCQAVWAEIEGSPPWRQTLINTMYDPGYHADATVAWALQACSKPPPATGMMCQSPSVRLISSVPSGPGAGLAAAERG